MKHVKKKYLIMTIIGIVLTALLFLKLINDMPKMVTLVIEVLSMLGGGIFCSAIVSWIIDIQNQEEIKRIREEQRAFILKGLQRRIINLYTYELRELSVYYANYISNEKGKLIKKELMMKEISEEIILRINKIIEFEENLINNDAITCIDSMYTEREERKHRLVKNVLLYYNDLYEELKRLENVADNYFVNNILSPDQMEKLKKIIYVVHENILFSTESNLSDDTFWAIKSAFYENTDEIVSLLQIGDRKEELRYRGV